MNSHLMYTDLSLFYLEQMGIHPWVRRLSSPEPEILEEKRAISIVLITQQPIKSKAKILLDKILIYLGLTSSEVLTVTEPLEPVHFQKIKNSEQIIVLGSNQNLDKGSHDLAHSLSQMGLKGFALIESLSLDQLLKYPIEKRSLFNQLAQIKTKL